MEGNGYEAWHSYLLCSFVSYFGDGLVSQYNINAIKYCDQITIVGTLLVFRFSMLIKWLLSRESAPPTLESSEVLCKRKFWHTPKTSHLPVAVLFISPRCSDGFDRHRSEWLTAGCNTSGIVQVRFWCITQNKNVIYSINELAHYRRIPKVTASLTFEFCGQKVPLQSIINQSTLFKCRKTA